MGTDGSDAVPALAEAMRGTNIVLCRLASKALSQIGTPSLATLIAHLQHADPFVRGESALAIGWMGAAARTAVPFLARVVRGPEAALTRTPGPMPYTPTSIPPPRGSESVTPPQVTDEVAAESAESGDVSCRVFAAQALGRMGQAAAAALADLRDASAHGPELVRQAAQQAVRLIQGE
jgi:HEAT repeat protein